MPLKITSEISQTSQDSRFVRSQNLFNKNYTKNSSSNPHRKFSLLNILSIRTFNCIVLHRELN